MFGIVVTEQDDAPAEMADQSQEQVFYLLPENEPAWSLWIRVQTQWRVGPAGYRTGMDYGGVVARMGRVSRRRQERLLDDVQVMELEALEEYAAQRERNSTQRGK